MGSFPDFAISDSDTTNDKFRILHNSGATQLQVDQSNVSGSSHLLVLIDGTETFRITGVGGSIGINETTPDSKVDIVHSTAENSSTENLIHLRTDPGGSYVTRGLYVKIGRDGQYDNSAAHYDIVGSAGNSGFHAFEVQGDEKLRITKDGIVGIGSQTPARKLDVNGIAGVIETIKENIMARRKSRLVRIFCFFWIP